MYDLNKGRDIDSNPYKKEDWYPGPGKCDIVCAAIYSVNTENCSCDKIDLDFGAVGITTTTVAPENDSTDTSTGDSTEKSTDDSSDKSAAVDTNQNETPI